MSERAWAADTEAHATRGRVEIFNATRPDGLDGWTMDERTYQVLCDHILDMIDAEAEADADGAIRLKLVVDAAQDRYHAHESVPQGTCAELLHLHQGRSRDTMRD